MPNAESQTASDHRSSTPKIGLSAQENDVRVECMGVVQQYCEMQVSRVQAIRDLSDIILRAPEPAEGESYRDKALEAYVEFLNAHNRECRVDDWEQRELRSGGDELEGGHEKEVEHSPQPTANTAEQTTPHSHSPTGSGSGDEFDNEPRKRQWPNPRKFDWAVHDVLRKATLRPDL
ncbi:hypothetical protein BKA93DRAFT_823298 [Sparassis latifolia]